MDLELLHRMCKEDTRKSFNEFKRIIDVNLFPFNQNVKEDLLNQLTQGLCSRTTKEFVTNNNLSVIQLQYLKNVTDQYKRIVLATSINYCKRFV